MSASKAGAIQEWRGAAVQPEMLYFRVGSILSIQQTAQKTGRSTSGVPHKPAVHARTETDLGIIGYGKIGQKLSFPAFLGMS
jgi:phosphoglycerate dehydrogenase-like enzyme